MSHCSQCGRFIGPYKACPYCGARATPRISVRALKTTAVIIASVGLAVLWLAATASEIPRIRLDQAGATTNMAYARVEGWVIRGPTYDTQSGYLSFTLTDGSGEIRVAAYREESAALRALGRVPALGDWVSVAGTLRVREDGLSMTVNVPTHVETARPEAELRDIGTLSTRDQLLRVRVRGQVWQTRQVGQGLGLVTLRDATGSIDVAVDATLEELTGALLPLEPGQSVEVVAAVDLYRDIPQLVPATVHDVILLEEPVLLAQPASVATLTAQDVGRLAVLHGLVTRSERLSSGLRLLLDDGTGSITVVLWDDVWGGHISEQAVPTGVQVRVTGEVEIYRGELELIPLRAVDVELLSEGADEVPP